MLLYSTDVCQGGVLKRLLSGAVRTQLENEKSSTCDRYSFQVGASPPWRKEENTMTKILRHPAKVGLLLALLIGLLGTGRCEMAMQIWADLQEQLDSQQEQICVLYEVSELDFPPECIMPKECTDPDCNPGGPGGPGGPA